MAQRLRVLVVDDDVPYLDLMREVLPEAGYEVTAAVTVPEALAAAARQPPDLVLVEANSPRLDGLEFVAAYRAVPVAHAPIVLVTTAPRAEQVAARIRAAGCLGKPFTLGELTALVKRSAGAQAAAER